MIALVLFELSLHLAYSPDHLLSKRPIICPNRIWLDDCLISYRKNVRASYTKNIFDKKQLSSFETNDFGFPVSEPLFSGDKQSLLVLGDSLVSGEYQNGKAVELLIKARPDLHVSVMAFPGVNLGTYLAYLEFYLKTATPELVFVFVSTSDIVGSYYYDSSQPAGLWYVDRKTNTLKLMPADSRSIWLTLVVKTKIGSLVLTYYNQLYTIFYNVLDHNSVDAQSIIYESHLEYSKIVTSDFIMRLKGLLKDYQIPEKNVYLVTDMNPGEDTLQGLWPIFYDITSSLSDFEIVKIDLKSSPENVFSDHQHPNGRGHEVIFNAVLHQIDKEVPAGTKAPDEK